MLCDFHFSSFTKELRLFLPLLLPSSRGRELPDGLIGPPVAREQGVACFQQPRLEALLQSKGIPIVNEGMTIHTCAAESQVCERYLRPDLPRLLLFCIVCVTDKMQTNVIKTWAADVTKLLHHLHH